MRVVIHKSGMLEMSIINVIFLTNVEKWPILIITSLLTRHGRQRFDAKYTIEVSQLILSCIISHFV